MNTRKGEKWRGQTGNKEGLKDGCKVRSVEEKKKRRRNAKAKKRWRKVGTTWTTLREKCTEDKER